MWNVKVWLLQELRYRISYFLPCLTGSGASVKLNIKFCVAVNCETWWSPQQRHGTCCYRYIRTFKCDRTSAVCLLVQTLRSCISQETESQASRRRYSSQLALCLWRWRMRESVPLRSESVAAQKGRAQGYSSVAKFWIWLCRCLTIVKIIQIVFWTHFDYCEPITQPCVWLQYSLLLFILWGMRSHIIGCHQVVGMICFCFIWGFSSLAPWQFRGQPFELNVMLFFPLPSSCVFVEHHSLTAVYCWCITWLNPQ